MISTRSLVYVALLLVALYSEASFALRPSMPINCLISDSELVVKGKVISLSKEPIMRDSFGDIFLAKFLVEKIFHGEINNNQKIIDLRLRHDLTDQAKLTPDKQYYLFISSSEAGRFITNGPQGAFEIDEYARKIKSDEEGNASIFIEQFEDKIMIAASKPCAQ